MEDNTFDKTVVTGGETVIVTDNGVTYPSHCAMAEAMRLPNWVSGNTLVNGDVVMVVGYLPLIGNANIGILGVRKGNQDYLISLAGVELYTEPELTIGEIDILNTIETDLSLFQANKVLQEGKYRVRDSQGYEAVLVDGRMVWGEEPHKDKPVTLRQFNMNGWESYIMIEPEVKEEQDEEQFVTTENPSIHGNVKQIWFCLSTRKGYESFGKVFSNKPRGDWRIVHTVKFSEDLL